MWPENIVQFDLVEQSKSGPLWPLNRFTTIKMEPKKPQVVTLWNLSLECGLFGLEY